MKMFQILRQEILQYFLTYNISIMTKSSGILPKFLIENILFLFSFVPQVSSNLNFFWLRNLFFSLSRFPLLFINRCDQSCSIILCRHKSSSKVAKECVCLQIWDLCHSRNQGSISSNFFAKWKDAGARCLANNSPFNFTNSQLQNCEA